MRIGFNPLQYGPAPMAPGAVTGFADTADAALDLAGQIIAKAKHQALDR